MGLDMYLNKYPKLGLSPEQIEMMEYLFEWEKRDSAYKATTFKQWSGHSQDDLPIKEVVDLCRGFYNDKYYAWDELKSHPYKMIHENVAYWRKANAIHGWFKRNAASDNLENCNNYKITRDLLARLLHDCLTVLENTRLVWGKFTNGYRGTEYGFEPIIEDGLVIENAEVCEKVMPTEDGFFFGSKEYTEWYLKDIKYTADVCKKLLEETDFSRYELYYSASW